MTTVVRWALLTALSLALGISFSPAPVKLTRLPENYSAGFDNVTLAHVSPVSLTPCDGSENDSAAKFAQRFEVLLWFIPQLESHERSEQNYLFNYWAFHASTHNVFYYPCDFSLASNPDKFMPGFSADFVPSEAKVDRSATHFVAQLILREEHRQGCDESTGRIIEESVAVLTAVEDIDRWMATNASVYFVPPPADVLEPSESPSFPDWSCGSVGWFIVLTTAYWLWLWLGTICRKKFMTGRFSGKLSYTVPSITTET
jgi:hypothetical protein